MKFVRGIALPDSDTHFAGQIEAGPLYEGKGSYQLHKLDAAVALCPLERRRHAVDVGAHVGLWTRVLAEKFKFVTAYEPVFAHRACMDENLKGLKNIRMSGFALGAENVMARMSPAGANSGNAHFDPNGSLPAPVRTMDSDDLLVGAIDLIKIDVEGQELNVIRGGEKTIREHRPVMVVEQKPMNAERYGFGQFDAVELLKSWGAKVAWDISGDYFLYWP